MMPQEVIEILTSNIDTLWVIDCAILVFIMQAGFMCMETGLSRHKNSINVALKNASDFGVSVVIFWIFGFGLMFGTSYNGFFGTDLFFFKTDKAEYMTYFVFQAMFVATAATIISGAVAERMKFNGYLIMTVLATGIIYPIVGHWAWSSSYLSKYDTVDQLLTVTGEVKATGWLSDLGFVDFAGSTIVHSVGGWIALAAVIILGPRIGKYSEANKGKFTGSSFPLAVLGTLILWFGWFGFNGGSNGTMDETVPLILINTFLAAAFGLLTGLSISYYKFKKPDPFYIILGPLAGLVAITAGCNSMTSVTSIFVGIVGAIIAVTVNEILNKFEIDDVVQIKDYAFGHVLELFHGPTLAFKDVAMQLLGRFLNAASEKLGKKIVILGATSGDTGSAAIAACQNFENLHSFIFFPDGKISEVQRKQMTTWNKDNVEAVSVTGNFDDCQDFVKNMFADTSENKEILFASINSINWTRILAQTVYFFYLSSRIDKKEINVSIPSGNFGHAYAGWYAKKMGLNLNKINIATNRNNVLDIFFKDNIEETDARNAIISASNELRVPLEKISVDLKPRGQFWLAEEYHQNFAVKNELKYKFYRFSCGRDQKLDNLWGDNARSTTLWSE